MAQVTHGNCIPEFTSRPELTPRWFGQLTPIPRAQVMCKEETRRTDGLLPKFGTSAPKIPTAHTDHWGLSAIYTPPYKSEHTSEGSLQLPIENQKLHFIPSVATLEATAHGLDTRLQPYHTRYY